MAAAPAIALAPEGADLGEAEARRVIVAAAREWLGTPYHHMADIKGHGVDCLMILVRVYGDLGLIPPVDPRPYAAQWFLHRAEEQYLAGVLGHAHEIAGPPLPGDILLIKIGRCFSHSAIVTDWPRVIHAYAKAGVIIDDARHPPFAGRPMRYFSLWKSAS
jgi:cell wall-associated NlpC family hydrolase